MLLFFLHALNSLELKSAYKKMTKIMSDLPTLFLGMLVQTPLVVLV